jgi:hypothetical protein
MTWSIDAIVDIVTCWLVTGELNPDILGEQFVFNSPFWKNSTRAQFINTFKNTSIYRDTSLVNIIKFDPILKFKNSDGYFAIVLQYHTKNGTSVYETVLGQVIDGYLSTLRSIYDLEETKKAHQLN